MRAQLLPADGGGPIDLVKDLVVVGRKEDCDVRLDHKIVSKKHFVLVKSDGLLLVRDLGSTNGTRVNGTRVRRAALLPTQRIDAEEAAALLGKRRRRGKDESSAEVRALQRNQLPDVYPDEGG